MQNCYYILVMFGATGTPQWGEPLVNQPIIGQWYLAQQSKKVENKFTCDFSEFRKINNFLRVNQIEY